MSRVIDKLTGGAGAVLFAVALLPYSSALAANSCTVSASALAFGTYIPSGGSLYSTSTIRVACTVSAFYGVGIGAGSTQGASAAQRLLANGTHTLQYNLYVNSSYSGIWGDGTGNTQIEVGTGQGPNTPSSFTVYGWLPDNAFNQLAYPGIYSDSVTAVVSF